MRYLIIIFLLFSGLVYSEDLYKYVNGERIKLTEQENAAVQAEWAKNKADQIKAEQKKAQDELDKKQAEEKAKQTLILPVLTQAQISFIGVPQKGRIVFNSTTNKVQIYNGLTWIELY